MIKAFSFNNPGSPKNRMLASVPAPNIWGYPSEDFTSAPWSTTNMASVVGNDTTAPDGTLTADRINVNSSGVTNHEIYNNAINLVSGTQYSVYIHAKADSYNFMRIETYRAGYATNYGDAVFNLSTGAIANTLVGTPFIEAAANGFYKCGVTFTAVATETGYVYFKPLISSNHGEAFGGSGGQGIYIWGFQQNVGTPSAYQKTT